MELKVVRIEKPAECNVILGQSHFIKTVEDLYEAIVTAVPGIKFGLAFCESSGDCLVRSAGTDEELRRIAEKNAMNLGTGHAFIILLGKGFYPINVLNAVKNVQEVCSIFAATANPLEVVVAESEQGRGILGVVDGLRCKGVESEEEVRKRKEFLRKIGYKL